MDRQDIQHVLDTDYAVPSERSLEESTTQLEALLASTDAFLRENALEILWQWTQRGHYTDEQMLSLGDRMASHLLSGTGESGTDSVFLRAFAALVLTGVLVADQRAVEEAFHTRPPFLPEDRVHAWFDASIACFRGEQDRRGYVETKGWAHALAHEADLLSDFARGHHLETVHLETLLDAIADKMIEPCNTVLCYNEGERLTQTVLDILRRNLVSLEFIEGWLQRLAHTSEGGHWADAFGMDGASERDNHARINACSFLRSLYFQLLFGSRTFRAGYLPAHFDRSIDQKERIIAAVLDALKATDKHFYAREDGS